MKKITISQLALLLSCFVAARDSKTEVLTLGVFHFNFPNLDLVKLEESDQIDVLDARYQEEIALLVEKLSAFRPTIIAIEQQAGAQQKTDSLYHQYLQGRHELSRSEIQQVGFRLAKKLGISKLYCVDEWGNTPEDVRQLMEDPEKAAERERFIQYFYANPDTPKSFYPENIYKTQGIIPYLMVVNDRDYLRKSLGNYLIGPFKYENEEHDFLGTSFRTGNWFSRNLKIFRNIQRIEATEHDRILVIFGSDHMNILNILFESSPEYHLVDTQSFLK